MDTRDAIGELRETLQPGDTLRTVLRHVSRSGMTCWVDVYKLDGSDAHYLTFLVGKAVGRSTNRQHEGVKCEGYGMDMGFDLVYSLSRRLWPDGFACIGDGCPSNDHSNGDRDYRPGHTIHKDGGYALRHRWL